MSTDQAVEVVRKDLTISDVYSREEIIEWIREHERPEDVFGYRKLKESLTNREPD